MSVFIRCLFGPRLYKIYRHGAQQSILYGGNFFESACDKLIRTALLSLSLAYSVGFYVSPLIAAYMYRKGYFTPEYVYTIGRFSGAIGVVLLGAFITRGFGRMLNHEYLKFLSIFDDYKRTMSVSLKEELSHFEYDFRDHPVEFRWNDIPRNFSARKYLDKHVFCGNSVMDKVQDIPFSFVSFIAMNCLARMLIYPGSIKLFHLILAPVLLQGRAKLIEEYEAKRYKLLSLDNNEIDCVFVDRRSKDNFPHGKTLVVCCEGNTGFYEMGITGTPLGAGYSLLGWNHPGFFDSTGLPFPDQETNAIDVVMQFAIHKLGFPIDNIVIYAWSIGGFTATWAAMNYPNIKGLVLDATFDDLIPLAIARMPRSIESIVNRTIREYMDLNVAGQLCRYDGPVLLVRRSRDEMISTRPSQSIQTNRGNDLLVSLLRHRYPNLVNDRTVWALNEWLSGDKNHQSVLWAQQEVSEDLFKKTLTSYVAQNSSEFPLKIGEDMPESMVVPFILYLADKYMFDMDSTHCVPLPPRLFRIPTEIWEDD